MTRTPSVLFANLICRFGERYVLLDLAHEVVLPAFTDTSLKRPYGSTSYFFFGIRLSEFENPDPDARVPLMVLHGQFIKDTVLTRTQVFSAEAGLVSDEESMSSAPSAFFALVLNNHKLVYLPETPYAPPLGTFASTVQYFLRLKHREYVNALYEQARHTEQPKTKTALYEEVPVPHVEVLPLASKASIEQFLGAFDKLTQLEFRILDTNQELQMLETYRQLRIMKGAVHSQNTKLTHGSSTGLDKVEAIEQIHASAATGNQSVQLAGTSLDGTKLRGDNHSFQLRVPCDQVSPVPVERAEQMVRLYQHQVEQGILTADPAEETPDKIEQLRERLPHE